MSARAAKLWEIRDPAFQAKVFREACQRHGLPEPVGEHVFARPRLWRFDFCWPQHMVAIESDGGIWTRGRHTRGKGYLEDMRKLNEAVRLGWRVVRATPQTLCSSVTLDLLRDLIRS